MSEPPRPSFIHPALSRMVLWMLVLASAFWVLQHIKTTLTIFGLAFMIAYLLNSVVLLMERRYAVRRGRAIALVYLLMFTVAGASAALAIPMIIGQVNAMVQQFPAFSERLSSLVWTIRQNYLTQIPEQYQAQLQESLSGGAAQATELAKAMLLHMRDFLLGLISAAFLMFTASIVSIYVIMRWDSLWTGLLDVLPSGYRHEIRALAFDLNKIFGGYLKAQITLATVCGLVTLVVLTLHSLIVHSNPYILVISVVAALTLPIPVLNQVIPVVTAAILGMINTGEAGYAGQLALLVWLVNQTVERTLAPRIMSEAVGVSALFVLLAAFSGAELLGPLGALLGVPLAAMAKSVFVWFHGRFLIADETEGSYEAEPAGPDPLVLIGALETRLAVLETKLEAVQEASRSQHRLRVSEAARTRGRRLRRSGEDHPPVGP